MVEVGIMIRRIAIPAVIILYAGELFGSWGVWVNFPTDSVRVHFPGYWSYEVLRLGIWLAILIAGFATAFATYRRKTKDEARGNRWFHGFRAWISLLCGGVLLETGTSCLYWLTPRAAPIRNAYQGAWYWDRIPPATDLGWPSFVGYLKHHLIAWAIAVIAGSLIWLACWKLLAIYHRIAQTSRTRSSRSSSRPIKTC